MVSAPTASQRFASHQRPQKRPKSGELVTKENTTIGVLLTNAKLDKVGARLLAEAGHDGLARAVVPAHTPSDGDALVTVSLGRIEAPIAQLRLMAAAAVEQAVLTCQMD